MELQVAGGDAGHVDADRGGVQAEPFGGRPGEHRPERAVGQGAQTAHERVDRVAVALEVAAVQGDGLDRAGPGFEQGDEVFEQRRELAVVGDGERPQRRRQDGQLVVGEPAAPHDGEQRGQQVEAAAVGFFGEAFAFGAAERERGFIQAAGVEDVERAVAAPEAHDLAAERADQGGVVGAQVAEDERDGAAGGGADAQPAHQRGLAEPGQGEQPDAGVGQQPGPGEPGKRVEADRLAGQQVPAEGGADRR